MRGLAYNPGILPAEMIIRQRVGWNDYRAKSMQSYTPATDAFLAGVRAQGVEMFAECAYTLEHHDHAVAFAAELRKGGNQ